MRLLQAILFLCLPVFLPINAQSIDALFKKIPSNICPLLNLNTRLDLLDLYNSGIKAKCENIFGGESEMTYKDGQIIRIKLTAVSHMELASLNVDSSAVMLVYIYTLEKPTPQSTVTFYSANWHQQKDIKIPHFSVNDFWTSADSIDSTIQQRVKDKLAGQRPVITCETNAKENNLRLVLTLSPIALSIEERRAATACLHSVTLTYNANGYFSRS